MLLQIRFHFRVVLATLTMIFHTIFSLYFFIFILYLYKKYKRYLPYLVRLILSYTKSINHYLAFYVSRLTLLFFSGREIHNFSIIKIIFFQIIFLYFYSFISETTDLPQTYFRLTHCLFKLHSFLLPFTCIFFGYSLLFFIRKHIVFY
jgi:hypothetical protein